MTATLKALAHRSDTETFEPGEPIYRELESGSVGFLLVEGEVVIEKEGQRDQTIQVGELFGEEALLGERCRRESARARTEVRVVPIGQALYATLAATDVAVVADVQAAQSRRMTRLIALGALLAGLCAATLAHGQVWEVGNVLLQPTTYISDGMRFGAAFAVGDFNGDHRDDLAIGAPESEGNSGELEAGKVVVHLGALSGIALSPSFDKVGTQADQWFGTALAAADFDGDGFDELAIGSPHADLGEHVDAGRVDIYKRVGGSWVLLQAWTQDVAGVQGAAETGDNFGWSLGTGDFNGDGREDLVIGVPYEDIGNVDRAGAFHVLLGGSGGLTSTGASLWFRGSGLQGTPEQFAMLGLSLAGGDLNGDGADDLAVGSPGATTSLSGILDGSVAVLYGVEGTGLVAQGQRTFDRETIVAMTGEEPARFGQRLAAADLDPTPACAAAQNCTDDLVISAPLADYSGSGGGYRNSGEIFTMFGSATEGELLVLSATPIWSSLVDGVTPSYQELFGSGLAAGQLGAARQAAVAVGAPLADEFPLEDVGTVHVGYDLRLGQPRVDSPHSQIHLARQGYGIGPGAEFLRWGSNLAIGDFDGDGHGDLAVGVPYYADSPFLQHGVVQILFGALFADGFEAGDVEGW